MAVLFACPSVYAECPDWYDLTGSHVKCEIGPYSARQTGNGWRTEVVDFGPGEISSRHTIHRDANEVDPRTTNNGTTQGLHTVPAGEIASVRLGNWLDGRVTGNANETGQAERITYTFTVTDDNKYLLMRYAIVWQDPHNHNDIVPSFQLETFLGATGNTLIDGLCYNFDYDAVTTQVDYAGEWDTDCRICAYTRYGTTQGYYYYNYNNRRVTDCPEFTYRHEQQIVAWRDWRTRLINLEDYVGQTVRLRFTSSDCGYVEHWGYSYFTLRCLDVNLYSPLCGGPTETRTFTAPDGLDYIWYKVNDDKTRTELLSESSNSLTVLNDGQLYECYIASPENANCHISLYAKAEPRLPLADFDIDLHEACVDTVFLTDNSGVSRDGVTLITPHENVDVVTWDFGDGRTNATYSPGTPITYDYDGTYTITQTARLTNGNCISVKYKTVTVRGKMTKHELDVYDTICAGDIKIWNGMECKRTDVYTFVTPANNHYCDSTVRLHLKVWDSYIWNDTIDVLEGKEIPYAWHSKGTVRNLYTSGVYWDSCVSVHGCDSVYKLVMNVRPKYTFHEYDTVCRGTAYQYHKNLANISYTVTNATDTIIYDSLLTKTYGNDSVYILHLHVLPTYYFTETQNYCQGDTVEFHGERFWTDGLHTVRFHTTQGCDSIFTLSMIQQPKYTIDTIAFISDKQKPFAWHGKNCFNSGVYMDSLKSVNGCDSVIRLNLTIYPTFFQEDAPITLCKDSTIKWHTKYITGTTVGTTVVWDSLKNQYGYDSVYKAIVTVLPSYRVSITEQRAIGDIYYFFGQPITTGGVYTFNSTTEQGCDSIVRLTISFLPTYLKKDTAYICAGDSYSYHKNGATVSYTQDGIYWDSLKTVHGYDSVYQLRLYVNSVYTTQQSAVICQPATYDFFGQTLTESGIYYKQLTSRGGCDSTVVLNLTVNSAYDISENVTICEGESYMFAGENRSTGGYYTQTYTTVNGCDSVRRLNLTVIPKTRIHKDVHLCTGESFMWQGEPISTNRIVSDTVPSLTTGCDSITIYHIYAHEAFSDTTRASICEGGSYSFHGHTYMQADTFTLSGTSVYGCDSTYVLILTVNPTYDKTVHYSLCLGDNITFNSKIYDRGGTYYDTLKTVGCGCDSAFIIQIDEYPRYFNTSTYRLCKDSTYIWHGQTITKAGTYYDSLKSVLSHNQCDSVYELIVTIQNPAYEVVEATILGNQSYSFNGILLNESGTYYDTLAAVNNTCDSIVELRLTVLPVYNLNVRDTICRGEIYNFNGKELEDGGLYKDTLVSSQGTDSIVNLLLLVYEPRIETRIVHISDQETYTWTKHDGSSVVLSLTGTYDDSLTSVITGCDSVNRLQLVVHQTYLFNEEGETCEGKPYYWRGNPYLEAGDHYDSLHTQDAWQYDSVYHLHLTVNPLYRHDTTVYICAGDYYDFNGTPISAGGTYYDTLPTIHGCDSMFSVVVRIRNTRTIPTTASICPGGTYTWTTWRSRDYSAGGTYKDTLRTKDGLCDSIYYVLTLGIKTKYEINLPPATICANQYYEFCGLQLNQTGVYDTTLTSAAGCDSILHLNLTVNPTYEKDTTFILCSGESVTFNGRVYSRGGNYRDTLPTVNGCFCDSIYNIHVNEIHPFFHTEQISLCKDSSMVWHGQVITGAGTYYDSHRSVVSGNKCDSVYELIVTTRLPEHTVLTATILNTTYYPFGTQLLNEEGIYYDTLPAVGNACDSIVELHLTVLPVFNIDERDTICRGEKFDFNGKELEDGGLYKDTLVSAHGTDSIVNLLLLVHEPRVETRIVHISDQETYTWTKHDGSSEVLSLTGTYDDSLKSIITGCDSVSRLKLVVHRTYLFEETGQTCEGTPYIWRGNAYTRANDYYDSLLTNTWHYDSVYHLTLTVNPIYRHDTTVYICEGGYYDFNGTPLSVGGMYFDTLPTISGCDSTFRATVRVRQTRTIPTTAFICPGEVYTWTTWRSRDLTEAKDYRDTLRTLDGLCDSIYYTLSLHYKTRYEFTLPPATICANQYYEFCGLQLNQTGNYDTTLVASNGCDSILHLSLTVNPTYELDTTFILCSGEQISFNGKLYSHGGHYRDTLYTVNGCNCDSVYRIHINEIAPFYHREQVKLCKDSSMEWHGQIITRAGTYYDNQKSIRSNGQCDSIYELVVSTQLPEHTVLIETILSTTYYAFGDSSLNESGIYFDTLPATGNACDSIVELRLTVLPVYNVSIRDTICRGDVYDFNGRELENGGLYKDTLSSVYSTDSVVNLTLLVHEPRLYEYTRHISDQESYTWVKHDGSTEILQLGGTYDDTLTSLVTGCDSIARLQLYVHPTYMFNEEGETCEGIPYLWRGNQYSIGGDYYERLKTDTWHYDSIYHLHLTINPIYHHDTTVYICAGNYYDFNGKPIFEGGSYYDTLKTEFGCNDMYHVKVNVRPTRIVPTTAYICPGEVYSWRGKDYNKAGDYTDTFPTLDGLCDSIYYTLALKHKPSYEKTLPPTAICVGDYYDFFGRLLNEAGDYDTTLVASNGCDSVYHLHLSINPTYDIDLYDTICEGRAVLFDNISRKESGIYVYNGQTKAGCDSIVTLHLTVIAKQTAYYEQHICEGDYIEIDGQRITQSGTYSEQSISSMGCDSTTIWRVSTHRPMRDTTYAAICRGQEYNFHDVIYREPGIYVQEDRSRYNCDSSYVLVLTVNPVYLRDTSVILCEHDFFTYNGHIYTEGGYYQDTARTKNGCNCDSILNITITKYPVAIIPEQREICRGDSTTWRGRLLKREGIYDDTIRMKKVRCDSVIYRLHLIVNQDYYEEISATICSDESVLFGGHTRNTTGVYYDSLKTKITGCDSVRCLKLTVNPAYHIVETVNRCDIEPYWYNGQWLRESGDYTQSLKTSCGCDSISILHLVVTPTKRDTVRVSLCEGEPYDYYGKPITQSGLYYDTINMPDISRCIVSVMDIGFMKPTSISNVQVDEICADDRDFAMRMYYTGSRPQMYSLIYDDKARAEGFVNVMNEPFDDIIYGVVPQKENGDYVRPDYYSARLIMDNDICLSAGVTAYEIELLVKYPSWIIEQNWNDVVALLNDRYNGGYLFSSYAWYVNGNKAAETGPYIYLPQTLSIGDEVYIAPTRQGEDYEVPSCPITIYDKSAELVSEFPVLANPTPIRGQFEIHAFADGKYTLISLSGVVMQSGEYRYGENLTINTPAPTGCYLLRVETELYGARTLKLILR